MAKHESDAFFGTISHLSYCNPFGLERIDFERQALGADFVDLGRESWHLDPVVERNPNLPRIDAKLAEKLPEFRRSLAEGKVGVERRRLYRDVALYHLYNRYQGEIRQQLIGRSPSQTRKVTLYPRFVEDVSFWLDPELLGGDLALAPDLVFAWFFQLRRAWHFIFRTIVGGSRPAARVRAAVWESVFTHDMRRYRRALYASMGDLTTLVTGPSGTGKELVARAIGLSRFIPFDEDKQVFKEDYEGAFFALNISALTPTLVESELFGHQRGAFTGAVKDRIGWLEVCPPLGAVFLDEIGEVDESIQVKLLRVLQTRQFQRLGDTQDRQFHGKLIAATNREPEVEMAEGRLREDFYYRLCSDLVRTASLREQLDEAPDADAELTDLVKNVAVRLVGNDEAETLVEQVVSFARKELGTDYAWSGNFRELEQCVRNVLIRGEYRPATRPSMASGRERFLEQVAEGDLDLETLTSGYVTLVYKRAGSYLEASRRLGLDRRTVKARVDEELLSEL